MSIFREITVRCPACHEAVTTQAVHSVNADRRPDLRDEILGSDFQLVECGKCGATFRLDPDLTYLDIARGQWLAVHPFGHLSQWESLESAAKDGFAKSYGAGAAPSAQLLGKGLTPRLVFGWAAMREKIFARDHELDDLALEFTKMSVLTSGQPAPITARTELRLVDVTEKELVMCWLVAESGAVQQTLGIPRALYEDIAGDAAGWSELRGEYADQLFVDMQRLMLAAS